MKILGIDTGGTYTDGVIIDRDARRVLRSAKALTTPQDLSVGLAACVSQFPKEELRAADLVCLSTTLATNAILEGRGGSAGLVLLGAVPDGELPVKTYTYLPAKIDIRGGVVNSFIPERALPAIETLRGTCDALAVSGYASVRNPTHEEQFAALARDMLGVPVVCAHELTGQLGFYERTVTAVLNARLLPIIRGLLEAVAAILAEHEVDAPVMIVRGDGSLMRADYAGGRPVETILSGPAASMIGARFLSGAQEGLIADMGGTSLDIVCVGEGEAARSREGAVVGGWRTRVRALDIRTYAIGGDSGITANEDRQIFVGPEKVVPLCRSHLAEGRSGITPTDIAHVTGDFTRWDAERATAGMRCFAERLDCDASALAELLAEKITDRLAVWLRESAEVFGADADVPVIGVGAPAKTWLTRAASRIGREICIPKHAEVANAVGAAAGKILELSAAQVRLDRRTDRYNIYSEQERETYKSRDEAFNRAREIARAQVADKAARAGARGCSVALFDETERDAAGNFVEYRVRAVAGGMPNAGDEQKEGEW